MVDNKEKDKFDLGVKGLTLMVPLSTQYINGYWQFTNLSQTAIAVTQIAKKSLTVRVG